MADKDIDSVDTQDNELESAVEIPEEDSKSEKEDNKPEKMLPASRVTQLIKKAKHEGERKMAQQLEEARAELERLKQAQQTQPEQIAQQQAPSIGGIQQPNMQEVEQRAIAAIEQRLKEREEAVRQEALQRHMQDVADSFFSKMERGKEMYQDFEDITASFDPAAFPSLVYLANEVDNTPAVIYELQKNPSKLTHLAFLVERSPSMARREIAKLSESIKANQQALQEERHASEPLSRLKPSTTVGADNSQPKTVRDFKNASWLKV